MCGASLAAKSQNIIEALLINLMSYFVCYVCVCVSIWL